MKKGFTLAEVLMPKRTRGMENNILHSRVSEGQGLLKNTIKHCAFTLAEVLITLAIIGVVAALTIPTVVHKYQQQQFYTQFMKVYNTLSNVFQLAQAEDGSYSSWDLSNGSNLLNKYFSKYLNISKTCFSWSECGFNENLTMKALNMDMSISYKSYIERLMINAGAALLTDGSLIIFNEDDSNGGTTFFVDTNGPKAPNTIGRDIFEIDINKIHNAFVITHQRLYKDQDDSGLIDPKTLSEIINDDEYDNCSTSSSSVGFACASRLLLEGKMSY